MNTRKPIMVAGLIAAISMGSVGVASAASKSIHNISKSATVSTSTPSVTQVDPDAAVLAKLVTAGTITQAQSDAVLAALKAAHDAARPPMGGGNGGQGFGPGVNLKEDLNVITTTLGITAIQLQSDLAAGKSLATIAGTKTSALITALVAAETTEINARVTSGALTQAQATTLIAGLNSAITTLVNATPPTGGMGHGGFGHGHGHGPAGAPGQGAPLTPGAPMAPSN
jgi:hypothetical protein